jgi:hypothetical protein
MHNSKRELCAANEVLTYLVLLGKLTMTDSTKNVGGPVLGSFQIELEIKYPERLMCR